MEEEIWKTFEEYPNYEVSSFGNVRNKIRCRLLKPSLNSSGYYRCSLTNNLHTKTFLIHRLVATCFIENTDDKPTVNHIDKNKLNNNLSNLAWATHLEQNLHKSKSTKTHRHAIKVLRICNKTGIILETYDSLKNASKWVIENNLSKIKNNNYKSIMSKISAVINNKIHYNTSFGFKWKLYKDDIDENEIWKQMPLYLTNNIEHYYASNYGNIKIKNRLKNSFSNINGYYVVSIMKKHFYVHRLIALTFLENSQNKAVVNHIDGNKLNNALENLEWTTCLENNMHKIYSGLSNWAKKVIQYDSAMNKLGEFNSIAECANYLNIGKSCVSDSCSGKYKTTKCGYIFKYV
jgi:hypothetical protein